MQETNWLLLANAGSTLYLVGLIWTVQRVHYPAFPRVERSTFTAFEAFHTRRITPVVAPAMIVEALTAAALLGWPSPLMPFPAAAAGVVAVCAIWLSTLLIQVPLHNKLAQQWDEAAVRRLIRTNWIRTAFWTARGALVLWVLATALSTGSGSG